MTRPQDRTQRDKLLRHTCRHPTKMDTLSANQPTKQDNIKFTLSDNVWLDHSCMVK